MKALIFKEYGGLDKLIMGEAPDPVIVTPDEVIVRVKATSLNHLDIWLREGIIPPASLPHISGCDAAGIVEEVGKGVVNFKKGDRVLVDPGIRCSLCEKCRAGKDDLCDNFKILGASTQGGYAEFVKVKVTSLISIPEGLSFEEAASFPLAYLTAYHMLVGRAKIRPGEEVLILGAGSGLGVAAIQIAKLFGAKVYATASADGKLQKAKALGADELINYAQEDFSVKVMELTGKRGVDIVLDHIGAETFSKSINSLARGGRLAFCGITTGKEASIDIRQLYARQISLLGAYMGAHHELITLTKLIGEKKIKPVVDSVYPLEQGRAAQQRMMERKNFGKIVLTL